jgi:hypothetical protein
MCITSETSGSTCGFAGSGSFSRGCDLSVPIILYSIRNMVHIFPSTASVSSQGNKKLLIKLVRRMPLQLVYFSVEAALNTAIWTQQGKIQAICRPILILGMVIAKHAVKMERLNR